MAITERRLTLEEFLALPERKPALEYDDGVVTQKVSPKLHHSALQGQLVLLLDRLLRPRKLGRAFPELRTTFAGNSLVPDVAAYVQERIPQDADGMLVLDAHVPPDVAWEILSPGQRVANLIARCLWYVANGVRIAILVDPRNRVVRVVTPGGDVQTLGDDDQIDLTAVFPGCSISVRQLFEALRAG